MSEIFGTFILSNSNESYSGEFFNNKMKAFSKEEIRVIDVSRENKFIGRFEVDWQEDAGNVSAVLEIDKEQEDIFMLTWNDVRLNGEAQNVSFTGRGVLRNELLVAVYSMNHLQYASE